MIEAVTLMRSRVLHDFRPGSCVVTCKATQRLLAAEGVSTRPLAVSALIANARWRERADAGLPPLDDPAAYSVGLGREYVTDGPVPVGHLILISDRWLIDPSIDQASRPLLPVKPAVLPLSADRRAILLAGGAITYLNDLTGVSVTYTGHPGDRGYTRSPNWGSRDAALVARMVGDVIREMR